MPSNTKPWFPFFYRDFWSDPRVSELTAAATGLYVFLLGRQWEAGALPADEFAVRNSVPGAFTVNHYDPKTHDWEPGWPGLWEEIEPLFPVDDDGLRRNPRMATIRADTEQAREKASQNGRAGADKLWGRTVQNSPAKARPRPGQGDPKARDRERERDRTEGETTSPRAPVGAPGPVRGFPRQASQLLEELAGASVHPAHAGAVLKPLVEQHGWDAAILGHTRADKAPCPCQGVRAHLREWAPTAMGDGRKTLEFFARGYGAYEGRTATANSNGDPLGGWK